MQTEFQNLSYVKYDWINKQGKESKWERKEKQNEDWYRKFWII